MTNDVLATAVLRLAHPYMVPTLQGDGEQQWLTVVEHPPLLHQLRGAVVGGTGPHAGGAGQDPRARLPFDPGAQALYDNIARIVATWYVAAGLRPVGMTLEGMLTEWARLYQQQEADGSLQPGSYERRAARIQAWCESIEALFDPPILVPITDPCPVCGRERVVNANDEHVYALVVEYWKAGEQITRSNARCRAADCATTWHGMEGIAALMAALDEQDAGEPDPADPPVEAPGDPWTASLPVQASPLDVHALLEAVAEAAEADGRPDPAPGPEPAAEAAPTDPTFDALLAGTAEESA